MLRFGISYLAAAMLLFLIGEGWIRRREAWAIPALAVYLTTGAWYFLDPLLHPEQYESFPNHILALGYFQVITFLVVFRLILPGLAHRLSARVHTPAGFRPIRPEILFIAVAFLWFVLFSCGVVRMEGDVVGALFPFDSRAGTMMWARGAAEGAGRSGFLIASGGYLYLFVCALFGILLFLQRSVAFRLLNLGFVLLTWPYFLLGGARSLFLAVFVPCVLTYLLLVKQPRALKVGITLGALVGLIGIFSLIANYRSSGFRWLLDEDERTQVLAENPDQTVLNMIQELCFINMFSLNGAMQPSYGRHYLDELLNVVPRAIWSGKPLLGIEYAKLRGFEGGDNDIGVLATISMGFIGGGVDNFGPYFGPIAPALLLSVWCALLARWWIQRTSILRLCLFLAGLGLTFNLGRDITLLVLWPIVFGYVIVRVLEIFISRWSISSQPNDPWKRHVGEVLSPANTVMK